MSKIMIMTTLKLKNENEVDAWKVMSTKIDKDLEGVDGFISRDSVRKDDGLIYCILKWESKEQQEKFMANLAAWVAETLSLLIKLSQWTYGFLKKIIKYEGIKWRKISPALTIFGGLFSNRMGKVTSQ